MKSQNQEWIERSRRAVWHPATQMRNLQSADIIADGNSGKGGGGGAYSCCARRWGMAD